MQVERRAEETFDELMRRFKSGIAKAGVLREYKRRRRFRSAGELRREKARAAVRRTKRGRSRGVPGRQAWR